MLLLSKLYKAVSPKSLPACEFLKKSALELLNSAYFTETTAHCSRNMNSLYQLMTTHTVMCSERATLIQIHTPSTTSTTSAATVEIEKRVEAVKKQLQEDVALLRRVGRVEGFYGVHCKALLQSGMHYVYYYYYDYLFNFY